ncbi:MAG TPA: YbhB/YbcL family Raf kinase inhibitor-like protein [Anaerolineae bacterium]|nr:YbhB/YbcL family Raf kinase inhibitor-like protein [Anaerolineae bacterium]HMR67765.1 YbhB/YbcL family Raf kinase inhibitor-like protein [Anaerolineae bacterium]
MSFELTSPAFKPGGRIPEKFTCDGDDIAPPLIWRDPPAKTQSFALIMDDPDAPRGTWVHWLLFNLPAGSHELPEAAALPPGTQVGHNGWGRSLYGGPCPPSGTHRYVFTLYALDTLLNLSSSTDKSQLLRAMEPHILAEAKLMGGYSRR